MDEPTEHNTAVQAAFDALLDDYHRQGEFIAQADIDRTIDKRGLSTSQSLELYERLRAAGISVTVDVDDTPGDDKDLEETPDDVLAPPAIQYTTRLCSTPLLTAEEEIYLGRQIAASSKAMDALSAAQVEDSQQLSEIIRRGHEARERMTLSNVRLVISIAKRYSWSTGMDLSDLIQEGIIGLIRAVGKFDHTKGYKFSTYATWWIRQQITRAIADKAQVVRFPVHVLESIHKLKFAERLIRKRNGNHEPSTSALADELAWPKDKVHFVRELGRVSFVSTDQPLKEEQGETATIGYYLEGHAPDPADIADELGLTELLEDILSELTERERRILIGRFGMEGEAEMTLEQLGEVFGVTRERIRQIEKKAISRVRTKIRRLGDVEEILFPQ